jgi:hypothetical protein
LEKLQKTVYALPSQAKRGMHCVVGEGYSCRLSGKGIVIMNTNYYWLERLQMLMARFSYFRTDADITPLSFIEAWQVYMYQNRLAEG